MGEQEWKKLLTEAHMFWANKKIYIRPSDATWLNICVHWSNVYHTYTDTLMPSHCPLVILNGILWTSLFFFLEKKIQIDCCINIWNMFVHGNQFFRRMNVPDSRFNEVTVSTLTGNCKHFPGDLDTFILFGQVNVIVTWFRGFFLRCCLNWPPRRFLAVFKRTQKKTWKIKCSSKFSIPLTLTGK